jgi:cytochrome c oxidase subunit 2
VEYIWTIIPAIVLTVLVINGLKTWNHIFKKPAEGTAQIEVFAFQFGWTARYPGADNKLGRYDFRTIGIVNQLGVVPESEGAADDITTAEIHLPVNKPVTMKFRAKDVIHSAWFPHFRAQMNVVPGLPTEFTFTPTITTAAMKEAMKDPEFEYVLLCNKICGSAHYRMNSRVVVDTQEDYDKWLAEQKPAFKKTEEAPVVNPAASDTTKIDVAHTAAKVPAGKKPIASLNK